VTPNSRFPDKYDSTAPTGLTCAYAAVESSRTCLLLGGRMFRPRGRHRLESSRHWQRSLATLLAASLASLGLIAGPTAAHASISCGSVDSPDVNQCVSTTLATAEAEAATLMNLVCSSTNATQCVANLEQKLHNINVGSCSGSDVVGTCVNPWVVLAEQLLAEVEGIAQACVNEVTPACQTALEAAKQVAAEVVADALGCATSAPGPCSDLETVVKSAAQTVEQTVLDCVNEVNPTCQTVISLVLQEANFVVATALSCATSGPGLCSDLETVVKSAAQTVEQIVLDCVNEVNPTCQSVISLVLREADFVVQTAVNCVNRNDQTCSEVFNEAQAVEQLIVTTVETCANGTNSTCNFVIQEGEGVLALVVATAEACVSGSNPTCNTVVQLAEQEAGLVVSTAETCVGGTNATCNEVLSEAQGVVGSTVSTVLSCVTGNSGTCNGALSLAASAVDVVSNEATGCALSQDPNCALVLSTLNDAVDSVLNCGASTCAPAIAPVNALIQFASANLKSCLAGSSTGCATLGPLAVTAISVSEDLVGLCFTPGSSCDQALSSIASEESVLVLTGGLSPQATQSTVPTTYCNGRSYKSIVKLYYRGHNPYPLRCGTSSWGFNHIKGRWDSSFDKEIAKTVAFGVHTSNGRLDYYPYEACQSWTFRVIYNLGAYNGNDVRPQGIITAHYHMYSTFEALTDPGNSDGAASDDTATGLVGDDGSGEPIESPPQPPLGTDPPPDCEPI
jgi:hypothetical protein